MYPKEFEHALHHAMLYEVGSHFKLTPDVLDGKIGTHQQRVAVGYVNDPLDNGGETKFGIARNANPEVDVTNLTWEQAKQIYYEKYWIRGSCDRLKSQRVAILHFDGCVNHGIHRASVFLQRSVGATEDGVIGPKTLGAVNTADEFEICLKIAVMREKFYLDIVTRRPSQNRFLKGWLRRINEIKEYVLDYEQ